MSEMLKVHKVSDEGSQYLKLLVYGPSGSGKTYLTASAEKPLILDAEGGLLSIREIGKDLECAKIDSFEDLEKWFDFLKNEKHHYKSVVIDSISEIHQKCVDSILKKHQHEITTMQDWNHITARMRKLLRNFRDLDMHIVFTALSTDNKDDSTGALKRRPHLYGRMAEEVPAYMDIVAYVFTKENKDSGNVEHLITTHKTERYMAKDRSGKLARFEEPDIKKILAKVFGKKSSSNK